MRPSAAITLSTKATAVRDSFTVDSHQRLDSNSYPAPKIREKMVETRAPSIQNSFGRVAGVELPSAELKVINSCAFKAIDNATTTEYKVPIGLQ